LSYIIILHKITFWLYNCYILHFEVVFLFCLVVFGTWYITKGVNKALHLIFILSSSIYFHVICIFLVQRNNVYVKVVFTVTVMQSNSSKEAIKGGKGDKATGNKSPAKGGKAAGAGAQKKGQEASPKTESILKKRGELEQEIKFISKLLVLFFVA